MFLKLRTIPTFQLMFDLAHVFLKPLTLLDQSISNSKDMIRRSEPINLNSTSDIVIVYASGCVNRLRAFDKLFLNKMAISYSLILVSNCNVHTTHHYSQASGVLTRKNIGRDLAAHRDILLRYEEIFCGKSILLLNSSCIWFPNQLNRLLVDIAMEAFDGISFMTDSHQRQEHIQSYFMFIPSQVIPKLMKVGFFHTFRNWHFKRTIIEKGEYKIKENLDLIEVNSRVIFQVESFVADKSKLKLVNPTIHFAADLLGCNAPFLKKSALLIKT